MKAGWRQHSLGEVLDRTGTINPVKFPEQEFEYVDVSSISNTSFRIETPQRLKGKNAPSRARRHIKVNDILFATIRPTLRRVAIVPEELNGQVCSTGYFVLRPKRILDARFVFYFLLTDDFMDRMESRQKGASYPAVTDEDVRTQPFAFPPIDEQQRIVAILDEAFAALTTAKANAEKNIQNARGLFESYLDRTLAKGGDGWAHRLLGDIADNVSTGPFGTMLHKSDYVPHGIPLINPMCLVNSRIVPSDRMMVSEKTRSRLRSYVLRVGDVVIGRRGDLGRCAVVTKAEEGWLCGTGSFFVRLSPCIDQEYFAACFRSRKSKGWLEEQCVGTTMQNLNHQILARLPILLPPIVTQRAIMARGKRLNECVARLIHNFDQKLFALEELKKSLLNEAFNGRL